MSGPSLLSIRWRDVLFAHWAVDPAAVRQRLPEGLSLDTYDGEAYLGIVGFRMDIRPRGSPIGRAFPELNLRTYVTGAAGPGVYFFSLDAADPASVAVARRLLRLPYYSAEMRIDETEEGVRFRTHRTHGGVPSYEFDATCRPTGSPAPPEHGSIDEFVTERFLLYAEVGGRLFAGPIEHRSWPLQSADLDVRENGLFGADGFEHPAGEPLVHYSPGVDARAQLATPVKRDGPSLSV